MTTAERIMKLETNVENLDKKVDAGFADLKTDLKELSLTVQQLVPTLVTQTQLTERITDLDKEIAQLKLEIVTAKRKSSVQTWVTSSLSAVLAVVLTVLIQSYLRG